LLLRRDGDYLQFNCEVDGWARFRHDKETSPPETGYHDIRTKRHNWGSLLS
jgi:hypothetical protein